jgi:hypothetical protein
MELTHIFWGEEPYALFIYLLLCWVGIHCSIYSGSYNVSNISYLNSPPQLFSFIPPVPCSWTYNSGWPRTPFEAQAALKLMILLPQPPECWDYRCVTTPCFEFSFYSFIVVLGESTLWHLQRFLQCIRYIIHEFTPSTALFHPFPLIPGQFQQGSFSHLYTCIYIICAILIFLPFPLPPPTHQC